MKCQLRGLSRRHRRPAGLSRVRGTMTPMSAVARQAPSENTHLEVNSREPSGHIYPFRRLFTNQKHLRLLGGFKQRFNLLRELFSL